MNVPTEEEMQEIVQEMAIEVTKVLEVAEGDYEAKFGDIDVFPALVHSVFVELIGVNMHYAQIDESFVDVWLDATREMMREAYDGTAEYEKPKPPNLRLVH